MSDHRVAILNRQGKHHQCNIVNLLRVNRLSPQEFVDSWKMAMKLIIQDGKDIARERFQIRGSR